MDLRPRCADRRRGYQRELGVRGRSGAWELTFDKKQKRATAANKKAPSASSVAAMAAKTASITAYGAGLNRKRCLSNSKSGSGDTFDVMRRLSAVLMWPDRLTESVTTPAASNLSAISL